MSRVWMGSFLPYVLITLYFHSLRFNYNFLNQISKVQQEIVKPKSSPKSKSRIPNPKSLGKGLD